VLKGIDPLLNGELLKILDELGHGDRLVIADRNFPSYSTDLPVVSLAVTDITRVFAAVLSVFPLDTFVDQPLERIAPADDLETTNETQRAVLDLARDADGRPLEFAVIPRLDFYEAAGMAHAVIHTLETAPFCDFILTKGVV
jgi:L-fucose mutarotase